MSARIDIPGIYEMPTDEYHSDCCPAPSLSASVAKIMLDQSPRHAWHAHPRLNPGYEPEESRRLDVGTIAHKLLLGAGRDIVIIGAPDYRSKAAQQEAAAAREAGLTPALIGDAENAEKMIVAARDQLASIGVLENVDQAEAERVLIWRDEGGIWCRSMLDKIERNDGRAVIWDYKTTIASAAPDRLGGLIADHGYDLAAGFYARGLGTLFPHLLGRITFRWIVQEIKPPYGLSVVEMDGAGQVMGAKKAAAAVALWRRCLVLGEWPLYPGGIVRAEYPAFHERRWLEREINDPLISQLIATPLLPEPEREPMLAGIVP